MKKRLVNMELLRILAMMMVVMLHYLGKGKLLPELTGDLTLNGYVAWGLESLSIVAVNVYMLISGYFLVESGFKPGRLVELMCQVLFYTLLVPLCLLGLGILPMEEFTIYKILLNILPVQMEQYWFITAYVIMYLFSPILSVAVKSMKQEQLKTVIVALLLFFSVSKTILPVELTLDKHGNDCIWFLCVFMVAGYIRLYGIPFFSQEKGSVRGIFCYLAGCAGIFCLTFAVRGVYRMSGSLDHFIKIGFDYNHVLNLLAAIGLFYGFLYMKMPQEGIFAKIILKVAPYSLGVYLLHEQLQVRTLWPGWLGASTEGNVVAFVLKCFGSVILVYVLGTVVDAVRAWLFGMVKKCAGLLMPGFCRRFLRYFYPLVLFLYPFRHVRVGAEWADTGYNYGNFAFMDHMDEMWLFSTYLGNAVGNVLQKLPFGDTMIGMNVYTGLFVSILALVGYVFYVKSVKLPAGLVFLGEFLAISLCWCPTALLYNYLTYFLMGIGYLLLYKALMATESRSRIYFVLAGIVLGVNVYTRFSNLAQMGLIVAVWAMGILRREQPRKVIRQTLWCILGYLLGLGGGFLWISLRYGADVYVNAILRLLQMPAEASSYTVTSMVMSQVQNYLQNLIWLSYIAGFVLVSIFVYALFPKKIKWIAKIGYIGSAALFFYYIRNQNMFNFDYTTKESAFQWAVILLTTTLLSGLIVIFGKKFTDQEKLIAGMNILMIVITPLGSNNHLYGSINNLFLVAPFTLWLIWRFVKWLPVEITIRKLHVGFYPIKAMCLCVVVMIFLQSGLMGWHYVFSESSGGKNLHTRIENSDILKGMLTSPDRAEAISSISAYVKEEGLTGREVILYGDIPAMSYYLDMPFAISAWPDLSSYNYEIMKSDLEHLEEDIRVSRREFPVILFEIRQGTYISKGEEALQEMGLSESEIGKIVSDAKLELLEQFIEKNGYRITYVNEKFVMFQADTERREVE